jgi:hypothetical protein
VHGALNMGHRYTEEICVPKEKVHVAFFIGVFFLYISIQEFVMEDLVNPGDP